MPAIFMKIPIQKIGAMAYITDAAQIKIIKVNIGIPPVLRLCVTSFS